MEPADVVQNAMKIVKDANVPPEVMPVAFAKVFDALVNQQSAGVGTSLAVREVGPSSDDPMDRVAGRLGVDVATAETVYDYHDGELYLAIHTNKLPPSKKRATEQIALLISAGRQAIGLDDGGTHINVVRVVAEHFKRYDQANFSTTINGLNEVMTVRGSGRDRTLKMTSPAWSSASDLVRKLTEA